MMQKKIIARTAKDTAMTRRVAYISFLSVYS